MTRNNILAEIKTRLLKAHKGRLQGIVLYGSEARGTARVDSDIDILVLLEEPVDYGKDLESNLKALYPLSQQIGRRISPKPIAVGEYNKVYCPLYERAHREGIVL